MDPRIRQPLSDILRRSPLNLAPSPSPVREIGPRDREGCPTSIAAQPGHASMIFHPGSGRVSTRISSRKGRRACRPRLDDLEDRTLLATVTVNATQVVRTVDPELLGVNLVEWDSNQNTAQTEQMVQAAGLNMFRFPGGSDSDDFHFNAPAGLHRTGDRRDASPASSRSINGVGVATLDYGSGSPQEAAAFLAYLNAPVGNTTAIGNGGGVERLDQHPPAGELADRRLLGQPPGGGPAGEGRRAQLTSGSNHASPVQRSITGRSATRNTGAWEVDHHGQGGDPGSPHDPTTYSTFAKQFANLRQRDHRPGDLGRDRRGRADLGVQRTGWATSSSSRSAKGFTDRIHQRPQLRPGPGQRERLDPAPRHRLRPQQPGPQLARRLGPPRLRL